MKIYFTSSTAELTKHHKKYEAIREAIIRGGHILTRDWLDKTRNHVSGGYDINLSDIKAIYKECITALREADLVIIEDTVSNFSTGHQITLALQYKIPVLVLWCGQKHNHFGKMFIHGIESDILQVEEYQDTSELEKIIGAFIKQFGAADKQNRFHLVLSNAERQYLDWAQFYKGKSRTQLIRANIRGNMENDTEYQEYLRGSEML